MQMQGGTKLKLNAITYVHLIFMLQNAGQQIQVPIFQSLT